MYHFKVASVNIKVIFFVIIAFFINGCATEITHAEKESVPKWETKAVQVEGVVQRHFYSRVAGSEVSYHIYIPDAYKHDKKHRFPTIYWLHGTGGSIKNIPTVVKYYATAMKKGLIPPSVVVIPYGMSESMWSNSKDGRIPMETVLINELVPDVDAHYRTVRSRKGRLIEGFSMGGYGAARLGIKYHEKFGAISILAGGPMQQYFSAEVGPERLKSLRIKVLKEVYGDDEYYFKKMSPWRLAEKNADKLRGRSVIRIVVGDQDDLFAPNRDFSKRLDDLRIPHSFYQVPGVGHNPMKLFKSLGPDNWMFYRKAIGNDKKVYNRARQRFIERLKRFDYDKNGTVYLSDVPRRALARARRLDVNHDGIVDAMEMR